MATFLSFFLSSRATSRDLNAEVPRLRLAPLASARDDKWELCAQDDKVGLCDRDDKSGLCARGDKGAGRRLGAVTLVLAALLPATPTRADDIAWEALAAARERLAAAPLEAGFVQTYVPAGFSTGDSESGTLYLALPGCLRWDYEEPFPRNYLLCASTVWVWSPDEEIGDRYLNVSRDEAGLDFLLLSVERLRERYEARLDPATEGEVRIALAALAGEPTGGETAFTEAEIVLDEVSGRPVRLGYTDRDGNETSFALADYKPLEGGGFFEAPADIRWVDGE
jgi:outer membrane lipoprotein-sorting protein